MWNTNEHHIFTSCLYHVSQSVLGVSSFSNQKILSGGWMSAEGAEIVDVDPDNPSSLELEHENVYKLDVISDLWFVCVFHYELWFVFSFWNRKIWNKNGLISDSQEILGVSDIRTVASLATNTNRSGLDLGFNNSKISMLFVTIASWFEQLKLYLKLKQKVVGNNSKVLVVPSGRVALIQHVFLDDVSECEAERFL